MQVEKYCGIFILLLIVDLRLHVAVVKVVLGSKLL